MFGIGLFFCCSFCIVCYGCGLDVLVYCVIVDCMVYVVYYMGEWFGQEEFQGGLYYVSLCLISVF